MGFWDSLFGGADQPYPPAPNGSTSTPPSYGTLYNPPDPSGLFNRLFAPKQLIYPGASGFQQSAVAKPPLQSTPVVPLQAASPAGAPVPTAEAVPMVATATGAAPIQPANTAQAVGAQPLNAGPAVSGPILAGGSGDILPCDSCPRQRPDKTLRAYVFNPELTSCIGSAQGDYLSKELGDTNDDDCESLGDLASVLSSRLVSKDGTPVAFVVPDGCDSVDLLYGPIEANPGCGSDDDLDQLVMIGGAKLDANAFSIDGPLTPGDQVIVTVPWRAASWVDLPANRLRVQIIASFYQSQPVFTPFSNS